MVNWSKSGNRVRLIVLQFFIIGLAACSQPNVSNTPVKENLKSGEVLFDSNCSSCHKIHVRDGFSNKYFWRNIPFENDEDKMSWMVSYLRNSDSLVQAGDWYSAVLKEEYNNNTANHEFDLSKKEVSQIVAFLKHYFEER